MPARLARFCVGPELAERACLLLFVALLPLAEAGA